MFPQNAQESWPIELGKELTLGKKTEIDKVIKKTVILVFVFVRLKQLSGYGLRMQLWF